MNRSSLVKEIARQTGYPEELCDRILRSFTDAIAEHIAAGEKVTISGFGTFERRHRRATRARNPQTGTTMAIAEQDIAAFRAGTTLREAAKSRRELS